MLVKKKKKIVISERIKFLVSLQKIYLIFWLKRKKKECLQYGSIINLFFHVRSSPCVLPAQPTLTEIQLWENFTVCHLIVPCPDPHLQFETGSCRNLLGSAFVWFWGPPKATSAAGKAPRRAVSRSICTCTNSAPLKGFIEWKFWSWCFRTSFTFTFVLVWHLHKIQRVLKQMTVGT